MIYIYNITTPANTSFENRLITPLKIQKGILHQLDLTLPAGSKGLSRMTINNALHQIYPSNDGGFFSGDNEIITFKENRKINDDEVILYAASWNLDELFSHETIIRIAIIEEKSWRIWF